MGIWPLVVRKQNQNNGISENKSFVPQLVQIFSVKENIR